MSRPKEIDRGPVTAETLARKERIRELEKIIARKEPITIDEYKQLLYEIRKNYLAALAVRSVQGTVSQTGAMINILDKVHWLIDSIEGKEAPPEDFEIKVKVEYDLPLPDEDA